MTVHSISSAAPSASRSPLRRLQNPDPRIFARSWFRQTLAGDPPGNPNLRECPVGLVFQLVRVPILPGTEILFQSVSRNEGVIPRLGGAGPGATRVSEWSKGRRSRLTGSPIPPANEGFTSRVRWIMKPGIKGSGRGGKCGGLRRNFVRLVTVLVPGLSSKSCHGGQDTPADSSSLR